MKNEGRLSAPAILLFAGLALSVLGCGEGDLLGANEGRVRFVLSSDGASGVLSGDESTRAPLTTQPSARDSVVSPSLHGEGPDGDRTGWFQSAHVTFSSILARNQDGELVGIDMELPVTVDVLKVDGGKSVVLPDGVLPTGTYDQVVVVMTRLEGIQRDGTEIGITPPGGGWTAIVPICPFAVDEGSTTVVGLTLGLRNAISWRDQTYHFQPRFSCEAEDSGS